MANKDRISPINLQFFAEGEPAPSVTDDKSGGLTEEQIRAEQQAKIEQEVENKVKEQVAKMQLEFEQKKKELEQQARKEAIENSNLSETEKIAKEREEFEKEKAEFEKLKKEQTILLNTEKVKSIYVKSGLSDELVGELTSHIGQDGEYEIEHAKKICKMFEKHLDQYKSTILANVQKNQPSPSSEPKDDGDDKGNSYFDKYNKPKTNEAQGKNKYFK